MQVSKLLLLTDVAGILDENHKLISTIPISNAKKIVNEKYVDTNLTLYGPECWTKRNEFVIVCA